MARIPGLGEPLFVTTRTIGSIAIARTRGGMLSLKRQRYVVELNESSTPAAHELYRLAIVTRIVPTGRGRVQWSGIRVG
jgi:hypothetical protein